MLGLDLRHFVARWLIKAKDDGRQADFSIYLGHALWTVGMREPLEVHPTNSSSIHDSNEEIRVA
jgi:hypothetical protein